MQKELNLIQEFIDKHREDLENIDFVVGISRGGLIPATLIAMAVDKPLITVYIDPDDNVYMDRGEWITNKRVLLVDDIIRTGSTFEKMTELIKTANPTSIQSFTLYSLHGASIQPTWSLPVDEDRAMPWDK